MFSNTRRDCLPLCDTLSFVRATFAHSHLVAYADDIHRSAPPLKKAATLEYQVSSVLRVFWFALLLGNAGTGVDSRLLVYPHPNELNCGTIKQSECEYAKGTEATLLRQAFGNSVKHFDVFFA
jgi:hypothetical protein